MDWGDVPRQLWRYWHDGEDEVTRVINEIRLLQQNHIPWQDILIIHASREETSHITARLNKTFGAKTAVDPGHEDPQNQIRVCSLNAATELESPIVFLMGIHDLYEREQSIRLSEEERGEIVRDNTRKLYMACTRAGQRLVITLYRRSARDIAAANPIDILNPSETSPNNPLPV